jgi:MFS family permease
VDGAQNMNWLVVARVVQGLGGGGCLTLATVIISDITTLRERPKFLAMGAFVWALGTNIGVSTSGSNLMATQPLLILIVQVPLAEPWENLRPGAGSSGSIFQYASSVSLV